MSTIPYGQAYKRNQGEGLGIELIIVEQQARTVGICHRWQFVLAHEWQLNISGLPYPQYGKLISL